MRARATWPWAASGGAEVRDAMISAYQFADNDPYRAATHNKGIMDGISAVVLATGNDTRAVESGAHAFAARTGRYRSLTSWDVTAEGNLAGAIERSEEHTSELQSLMRISYAVFCLKKKTTRLQQ